MNSRDIDYLKASNPTLLCQKNRGVKKCSDCIRYRSCAKSHGLSDDGNIKNKKGGYEMSPKNQEIEKFVRSLYWPKKKLADIGALLTFLEKSRLRSIEQNDRHRCRLSCLEIITLGVGERASFVSWDVKYIDINHVSNEYAEIYTYTDEERGLPRKIKINNPKITIIEKIN